MTSPWAGFLLVLEVLAVGSCKYETFCYEQAVSERIFYGALRGKKKEL